MPDAKKPNILFIMGDDTRQERPNSSGFHVHTHPP
jgi:hypothetical protein